MPPTTSASTCRACPRLGATLLQLVASRPFTLPAELTSSQGHAGTAPATSDNVQLGVAPYYRVIDWQYGVSSSGRPLRLAVAPEAGFRFTYLRGEIDVHHGPTVDQNESWVEPLIGSRFTLDLADRWTLAAEANVGGFGVGSDFAWNAQALLGYRTILLGRETTFALATALHQDYDRNDFKWDATICRCRSRGRSARAAVGSGRRAAPPRLHVPGR